MPTEWPSSGYLIHFTTVAEHAHVWVDSLAGVTHVEAWLQNPDDSLGIPGAPIELNGQFNPGYSFRLVPSEVTFADFWIEVCDATACYVESDPQNWIDGPQTWCPWSFQVEDVWDCTGAQNPCPHVYP